MKKTVKQKSNRHTGKAKPSRFLTREDILNTPDAPIGERACDAPVSKGISSTKALMDSINSTKEFIKEMSKTKEFIDVVLKTKRLKDDAAQELTGDKTEIPDWWERALEVCKATGMQPDGFNRLTDKDEIKVLRTAAKIKRRENKKHSLPLGVKAWADVFDVGKNKMREMMNGTDYHFKKLGGEKGRKWTLPLNELPAEYLEKYRKSIS